MACLVAQVRDKLVVVNGDLGMPGLGLSPADRNALVRDVQFIVHSAASISFVDHIHRLIAHNYVVSSILPYFNQISPTLPSRSSLVCPPKAQLAVMLHAALWSTSVRLHQQC